MTGVSIRAIGAREVVAASQLVAVVFSETVAPAYSQQGCDEFLSYAAPGPMADRLHTGHRLFVADSGGEIVGVLETRGGNHVSLLFVATRLHGRGVGRALLSAAAASGALTSGEKVTVNASPNSVRAYERLGFEAVGVQQELNGIRFVPIMRAAAGWPGP